MTIEKEEITMTKLQLTKINVKCPCCKHTYSSTQYPRGSYGMKTLEREGQEFEEVSITGAVGAFTFLICPECGTVMDPRRCKKTTIAEMEIN